MKVFKIFFVTTIFLVTLGVTVYTNISSNCGDKTPYKEAQIILRQIEFAIKEYNLDTGQLPNKLEQLLIDTQTKNWMGPYLRDKKLTDPWGENYRYQVLTDKLTFVIGTLGSDKKPGGKKLATDILISSSLKFDE